MADFDELLPEEAEERTGNGEQTRSTGAKERPWRRRLSTVAAVLFVILLVGSLLLVVSRTRRSSPDAPGTTLHPSKLVGGPGSLISLHMIDPTTGWALSEHAVLRTADGGFHWKNVTPPNTLLTRESIADFLTASLAWVKRRRRMGQRCRSYGRWIVVRPGSSQRSRRPT